MAFTGDASQPANTSLTDDAKSREVFYSVIGFSNLDGIVKLDPPRGKKSRFAVLLVDKIDDMTALLMAVGVSKVGQEQPITDLCVVL